jgi:3-oxoacyl-[acyl-carrier protein] reductase
MNASLASKVALVTGAGKNIGRAIALRLAADGAAIVVNGRSDEAAIKAVADEIIAFGGRAMAYRADISKPEEVAGMAAAVAAQMGGVDILVTNAGLRRQTSFLDMSFAEWREILSVALDGAFIVAQAFAPQMIARGGGSIIGLSGISTHVGTPNRAHVSASKSGLEGLMRALAVELAPQGIRANSVAPGAVDTVRLGRVHAQHAGRCGHTAGPARECRRNCRCGADAGRARGWLHHRPDHSREWRGVPDLKHFQAK